MKFTREFKPVTYIHYGADHFDISKFKEVKNEWHKPKKGTGLWGSPVNAVRSWKNWCEDEHFRECNDDNAFKFIVRNPEKIFFVDSAPAYLNLTKRYGIANGWGTSEYNPYDIDFEKMISDGWDGLEISISDWWKLYDLLYGWDCDSIVIFNKDCIIEVEKEEIEDEFTIFPERESLGDNVFSEWDSALRRNEFV